jgi:hypothetical protein
MLFPLPALHAVAPICLYQDVLSGPASGGEGGNGIYLSIFGHNFGSTRGTSTVTVNGTPVAQYLVWGSNNDVTGEHDQIGVQIASGTTSGAITVTTADGSCSNLSFTVRSGNIYFIGSAVDTSAPGSCPTMKAANSYASPWGLYNWPGFTQSTPESSYSYSTQRTPYTYYNCLNDGDTLVFLNGVNYHWFDGRGWHSSLTPDKTQTSSSFVTIMARPGATATLGAEGWVQQGIREASSPTYSVYSGMTLIGSGANGEGISFNGFARMVGNTVNCPDCVGPAGAVEGDDPANGGYLMYGNLVTLVSTDATKLPNGSNKTYHDVYFQGNNWEFAWNRIYNTAAYNGFQINEDSSPGFYNFAIHDNDIADVNGSGINLSTIDPSSGYVQVYNNIVHHTGVNLASDGGSDNPHSCIAVKGYGSATGVGTAYIWNNTMYDCSSYLNTSGVGYGEGESCAVYGPANQLNVTINLVNNVTYQPAYAYTGNYNVYTCGDGSFGTLSGSNNIWYSASTPGSTAYATTVGTIENPLYVSATDGPWTNYELQATSPAIGAGTRVGPVESLGASNTYLTWDFQQLTRPNPPAIGALEYSSAPSYTLTVSTTTGTGTGTINITNNCQTGSFTSGTTIGPCTATPNAGSVFAGWTGTLGCTGTGTCTASLTGNSTMNAVFNLASSTGAAAMQGTGIMQGTAVIQ